MIGALAVGSTDAASGKRTKRRPAPPPELVWHVEAADGTVLETNADDRPVNPASVVKVATSWWALRQLGPGYRFDTEFVAAGPFDPDSGVLRGDLVVLGQGDPDFHVENALLVAAALNDLGLRKVTGALVVNGQFWTGWENGSQGTDPDSNRRAVRMAGRLRRALNPALWGRGERAAWQRVTKTGRLAAGTPPRVTISGGLRSGAARPDGSTSLLVHRSKPLADTLRRFNCYSNNDIERIGSLLGSPSDLGSLLTAMMVGPSDSPIRLETTSGLGENRLTPRQIVELLRAFRRSAERLGLGVEGLLPVAGCDPGTVTRFFPRLSSGEYATALVAKTGTLVTTDGGVSALAGFVNTAAGELTFAVVAPRAAGRLRSARAAEERWLVDLIARHGGPRPRRCAPPLGGPESGADIVMASEVPVESARVHREAMGPTLLRSVD